jgi:hypothetical protein
MWCVTNGSTHLSAWVTAETKQRFSALAREFGLSESALLKRSITLMLRSTALPEAAVMTDAAKVPQGLQARSASGSTSRRRLCATGAKRSAGTCTAKD